MTRRRITAHKAHHVPNPTDRGAAQYIGTVPPLPPEVIARARKVALDHGADDELLDMLGLAVTA